MPDGAIIVGHVGGDAVLLTRSGGEIFAVGATCTHYGGPLGDGLLVGDTVRCPWHHACFSLRTGEAVRAPALNDIACYYVVQRDGKLFVGDARKTTASATPSPAAPSSIVILGGGAAAQAALETLRREGYGGPITVLSADGDTPCDRPNLSKDYLAGTAQDDWIPLRDAAFYQRLAIDLLLGTRVAAIDPQRRSVRTQDGRILPYGALLIATGAEPIRLDARRDPAARALSALPRRQPVVDRGRQAGEARRGDRCELHRPGGRSLRNRQLEVDVVAPEPIPMERIMGPDIGTLIRTVHEEHGVRFHLQNKVRAISEREVQLEVKSND